MGVIYGAERLCNRIGATRSPSLAADPSSKQSAAKDMIRVPQHLTLRSAALGRVANPDQRHPAPCRETHGVAVRSISMGIAAVMVTAPGPARSRAGRKV
jgi:hypothetical protein